jgi:hypothetical protein
MDFHVLTPEGSKYICSLVDNKVVFDPPEDNNHNHQTQSMIKAAVKIPPLFKVKSSSIAEVGHANGELFVRFAKGRLYRYPGVSLEQFAKLRKAESVGKHLQVHILAHHTGTLVPEPDGA